MATIPAKETHVKPLPDQVLIFTGAMMRAVKTARLYSRGHELFKKNILPLFQSLMAASGDQKLLFLGCAKDTLFLEGFFYPARDPQLKTFLEFFHSLGISHLLIDKRITQEELESLVGLLAGARQDQGEEISSALSRENIRHVNLGLLDYTIFSAIQVMAAEIAQSLEDEAFWRQLIIQPAAAGSPYVSPEKIQELVSIAQDVEGLKKVLQQLDSNLVKKQKGISLAQRGLILGNFLQNFGNIMTRVGAKMRGFFAEQVAVVLDSLDPGLKTHILGAIPPEEAGRKEGGVLCLLFDNMPDGELVSLLIDALKDAGPNSTCFNNILNRALTRYNGPSVLLDLVRGESIQASQEKGPKDLEYRQRLEQFLIRQQEIEDFNVQYRQEVDSLATSIMLQKPMVEEVEKARLIKTLAPEALKEVKAELITILMNQPHTAAHAGLFYRPLLSSLGESLSSLFIAERYLEIGRMLRRVYLTFSNLPQEAMARGAVGSWLNTQEIRTLLKALLERCRKFDAKETSAINAVCHLFPEKAVGFLLDELIGLDAQESPYARWLWSSLLNLATHVPKPLSQRLADAPDRALPRLLELVTVSSDKNLAAAVEGLLDHKDDQIRSHAVRTLGNLKAEGSVPGLARILLDKSWFTGKKMKALQIDAARALADIGTERAKEILRQATIQGFRELRDLCRELV